MMNQNYNYNNYWGNNPQQGFVNYGYNRTNLPEPTNPLTKEQINILKQKAPQFSLAVSEVENLKAVCTHRNKEGDCLNKNSNGTATCSLCGSTITPVNPDLETVKQVFKSAIDILESIKIMYMDIPNEVTLAYFQMIPYLNKAPELYKIASEHFERYNNNAGLGNVYNGAGNTLNMYNSIMNPGFMGGMGMGMYPMGQPMYPMGQPGMVQPQPMQNMQQPIPDVTVSAGTPNTGVNPFDSASPALNATATVTDNKQYSL